MGQHHFTMPFGVDLFQGYGGVDCEIHSGAGVVEIDMVKGERMSELSVTITGNVDIDCDRCADQYSQAIDFEEIIVVKVSPQADEFKASQDGDVIWLLPNEHELDLTQWIYESIMLSLPIMRVHTDIENCNKETLKYLNGTVDTLQD